ncbi:MAG: hypothetical protein KBD53_09950, partial [Candidatus Omnitrophica bacterium]|nr:hypothetical protein [Candidatus Omnitrophota bacterium]
RALDVDKTGEEVFNSLTRLGLEDKSDRVVIEPFDFYGGDFQNNFDIAFGDGSAIRMFGFTRNGDQIVKDANGVVIKETDIIAKNPFQATYYDGYNGQPLVGNDGENVYGQYESGSFYEVLGSNIIQTNALNQGALAYTLSGREFTLIDQSAVRESSYGVVADKDNPLTYSSERKGWVAQSDDVIKGKAYIISRVDDGEPTLEKETKDAAATDEAKVLDKVYSAFFDKVSVDASGLLKFKPQDRTDGEQNQILISQVLYDITTASTVSEIKNASMIANALTGATAASAVTQDSYGSTGSEIIVGLTDGEQRKYIGESREEINSDPNKKSNESDELNENAEPSSTLANSQRIETDSKDITISRRTDTVNLATGDMEVLLANDTLLPLVGNTKNLKFDTSNGDVRIGRLHTNTEVDENGNGTVKGGSLWMTIAKDTTGGINAENRFSLEGFVLNEARLLGTDKLIINGETIAAKVYDGKVNTLDSSLMGLNNGTIVGSTSDDMLKPSGTHTTIIREDYLQGLKQDLPDLDLTGNFDLAKMGSEGNIYLGTSKGAELVRNFLEASKGGGGSSPSDSPGQIALAKSLSAEGGSALVALLAGADANAITAAIKENDLGLGYHVGDLDAETKLWYGLTDQGLSFNQFANGSNYFLEHEPDAVYNRSHPIVLSSGSSTPILEENGGGSTTFSETNKLSTNAGGSILSIDSNGSRKYFNFLDYYTKSVDNAIADNLVPELMEHAKSRDIDLRMRGTASGVTVTTADGGISTPSGYQFIEVSGEKDGEKLFKFSANKRQDVAKLGKNIGEALIFTMGSLEVDGDIFWKKEDSNKGGYIGLVDYPRQKLSDYAGWNTLAANFETLPFPPKTNQKGPLTIVESDNGEYGIYQDAFDYPKLKESDYAGFDKLGTPNKDIGGVDLSMSIGPGSFNKDSNDSNISVGTVVDRPKQYPGLILETTPNNLLITEKEVDFELGPVDKNKKESVVFLNNENDKDYTSKLFVINLDEDHPFSLLDGGMGRDKDGQSVYTFGSTLQAFGTTATIQQTFREAGNLNEEKEGQILVNVGLDHETGKIITNYNLADGTPVVLDTVYLSNYLSPQVVVFREGQTLQTIASGLEQFQGFTTPGMFVTTLTAKLSNDGDGLILENSPIQFMTDAGKMLTPTSLQISDPTGWTKTVYFPGMQQSTANQDLALANIMTIVPVDGKGESYYYDSAKREIISKAEAEKRADAVKATVVNAGLKMVNANNNDSLNINSQFYTQTVDSGTKVMKMEGGFVVSILVEQKKLPGNSTRDSMYATTYQNVYKTYFVNEKGEATEITDGSKIFVSSNTVAVKDWEMGGWVTISNYIDPGSSEKQAAMVTETEWIVKENGNAEGAVIKDAYSPNAFNMITVQKVDANGKPIFDQQGNPVTETYVKLKNSSKDNSYSFAESFAKNYTDASLAELAVNYITTGMYGHFLFDAIFGKDPEKTYSVLNLNTGEFVKKGENYAVLGEANGETIYSDGTQLTPGLSAWSLILGSQEGGLRGRNIETSFSTFLNDGLGLSSAWSHALDITNPSIVGLIASATVAAKGAQVLQVATRVAAVTDSVGAFAKGYSTMSVLNATQSTTLLNASFRTGFIMAGTDAALYVAMNSNGELSLSDMLLAAKNGFQTGVALNMVFAGLYPAGVLGGKAATRLEQALAGNVLGKTALEGAQLIGKPVLNAGKIIAENPLLSGAALGAGVNVGRGYFMANLYGEDYDLLSGQALKDAGVGALMGMLVFGATDMNMVRFLGGTSKGSVFLRSEAEAASLGERLGVGILGLGTVGVAGGLVNASETGFSNYSGVNTIGDFFIAGGMGALIALSPAIGSRMIDGSRNLSQALPDEAAIVKGSGGWRKTLQEFSKEHTVLYPILSTGAYAGAGAAAGWGVSFLDPKLKDTTWNDFGARGSHIAYGAMAGLLMKGRSAVAPKLNKWALGEQSGSIGLKQMAENPDLFWKMGIMGGVDFAAIMPAWGLLDAPLYFVVDAAKSNSKGEYSFDVSAEKGFHHSYMQQEMDENGNMVDAGLLQSGLISMLSGFQMGLTLGPGLGVGQMPMSAFVKAGEKEVTGLARVIKASGDTSTLGGKLFHSMPGTILQLNAVEVVSEQVLEHTKGDKMYAEGLREAETESWKRVFSGGAAMTAEQKHASAENYKQQMLKAEAGEVAFVSLFFKPTMGAPLSDLKKQVENNPNDGNARLKLAEVSTVQRFMGKDKNTSSEEVINGYNETKAVAEKQGNQDLMDKSDKGIAFVKSAGELEKAQETLDSVLDRYNERKTEVSETEKESMLSDITRASEAVDKALEYHAENAAAYNIKAKITLIRGMVEGNVGDKAVRAAIQEDLHTAQQMAVKTNDRMGLAEASNILDKSTEFIILQKAYEAAEKGDVRNMNRFLEFGRRTELKLSAGNLLKLANSYKIRYFNGEDGTAIWSTPKTKAQRFKDFQAILTEARAAAKSEGNTTLLQTIDAFSKSSMSEILVQLGNKAKTDGKADQAEVFFKRALAFEQRIKSNDAARNETTSQLAKNDVNKNGTENGFKQNGQSASQHDMTNGDFKKGYAISFEHDGLLPNSRIGEKPRADSVFEITFTSETEGIVTVKEGSESRALMSSDGFLKPASDFVNFQTNETNFMKVLKPGKITKVGDTWKITEKMDIAFFNTQADMINKSGQEIYGNKISGLKGKIDLLNELKPYGETYSEAKQNIETKIEEISKSDSLTPAEQRNKKKDLEYLIRTFERLKFDKKDAADINFDHEIKLVQDRLSQIKNITESKDGPLAGGYDGSISSATELNKFVATKIRSKEVITGWYGKGDNAMKVTIVPGLKDAGYGEGQNAGKRIYIDKKAYDDWKKNNSNGTVEEFVKQSPVATHEIKELAERRRYDAGGDKDLERKLIKNADGNAIDKVEGNKSDSNSLNNVVKPQENGTSGLPRGPGKIDLPLPPPTLPTLNVNLTPSFLLSSQGRFVLPPSGVLHNVVKAKYGEIDGQVFASHWGQGVLDRNLTLAIDFVPIYEKNKKGQTIIIFAPTAAGKSSVAPVAEWVALRKKGIDSLLIVSEINDSQFSQNPKQNAAFADAYNKGKSLVDQVRTAAIEVSKNNATNPDAIKNLIERIEITDVNNSNYVNVLSMKDTDIKSVLNSEHGNWFMDALAKRTAILHEGEAMLKPALSTSKTGKNGIDLKLAEKIKAAFEIYLKEDVVVGAVKEMDNGDVVTIAHSADIEKVIIKQGQEKGLLITRNGEKVELSQAMDYLRGSEKGKKLIAEYQSLVEAYGKLKSRDEQIPLDGNQASPLDAYGIIHKNVHTQDLYQSIAFQLVGMKLAKAEGRTRYTSMDDIVSQASESGRVSDMSVAQKFRDKGLHVFKMSGTITAAMKRMFERQYDAKVFGEGKSMIAGEFGGRKPFSFLNGQIILNENNKAITTNDQVVRMALKEATKSGGNLIMQDIMMDKGLLVNGEGTPYYRLALSVIEADKASKREVIILDTDSSIYRVKNLERSDPLSRDNLEKIEKSTVDNKEGLDNLMLSREDLIVLTDRSWTVGETLKATKNDVLVSIADQRTASYFLEQAPDRPRGISTIEKTDSGEIIYKDGNIEDKTDFNRGIKQKLIVMDYTPQSGSTKESDVAWDFLGLRTFDKNRLTTILTDAGVKDAQQLAQKIVDARKFDAEGEAENRLTGKMTGIAEDAATFREFINRMPEFRTLASPKIRKALKDNFQKEEIDAVHYIVKTQRNQDNFDAELGARDRLEMTQSIMETFINDILSKESTNKNVIAQLEIVRSKLLLSNSIFRNLNTKGEVKTTLESMNESLMNTVKGLRAEFNKDKRGGVYKSLGKDAREIVDEFLSHDNSSFKIEFKGEETAAAKKQGIAVEGDMPFVDVRNPQDLAKAFSARTNAEGEVSVHSPGFSEGTLLITESVTPVQGKQSSVKKGFEKMYDKVASSVTSTKAAALLPNRNDILQTVALNGADGAELVSLTNNNDTEIKHHGITLPGRSRYDAKEKKIYSLATDDEEEKEIFLVGIPQEKPKDKSEIIEMVNIPIVNGEVKLTSSSNDDYIVTYDKKEKDFPGVSGIFINNTYFSPFGGKFIVTREMPLTSVQSQQTVEAKVKVEETVEIKGFDVKVSGRVLEVDNPDFDLKVDDKIETGSFVHGRVQLVQKKDASSDNKGLTEEGNYENRNDYKGVRIGDVYVNLDTSDEEDSYKIKVNDAGKAMLRELGLRSKISAAASDVTEISISKQEFLSAVNRSAAIQEFTRLTDLIHQAKTDPQFSEEIDKITKEYYSDDYFQETRKELVNDLVSHQDIKQAEEIAMNVYPAQSKNKERKELVEKLMAQNDMDEAEQIAKAVYSDNYIEDARKAFVNEANFENHVKKAFALAKIIVTDNDDVRVEQVATSNTINGQKNGGIGLKTYSTLEAKRAIEKVDLNKISEILNTYFKGNQKIVDTIITQIVDLRDQEGAIYQMNDFKNIAPDVFELLNNSAITADLKKLVTPALSNDMDLALDAFASMDEAGKESVLTGIGFTEKRKDLKQELEKIQADRSILKDAELLKKEAPIFFKNQERISFQLAGGRTYGQIFKSLEEGDFAGIEPMLKQVAGSGQSKELLDDSSKGWNSVKSELEKIQKDPKILTKKGQLETEAPLVFEVLQYAKSQGMFNQALKTIENGDEEIIMPILAAAGASQTEIEGLLEEAKNIRMNPSVASQKSTFIQNVPKLAALLNGGRSELSKKLAEVTQIKDENQQSFGHALRTWQNDYDFELQFDPFLDFGGAQGAEADAENDKITLGMSALANMVPNYSTGIGSGIPLHEFFHLKDNKAIRKGADSPLYATRIHNEGGIITIGLNKDYASTKSFTLAEQVTHRFESYLKALQAKFAFDQGSRIDAKTRAREAAEIATRGSSFGYTARANIQNMLDTKQNGTIIAGKQGNTTYIHEDQSVEVQYDEISHVVNFVTTNNKKKLKYRIEQHIPSASEMSAVEKEMKLKNGEYDFERIAVHRLNEAMDRSIQESALLDLRAQAMTQMATSEDPLAYQIANNNSNNRGEGITNVLKDAVRKGGRFGDIEISLSNSVRMVSEIMAANDIERDEKDLTVKYMNPETGRGMIVDKSTGRVMKFISKIDYKKVIGKSTAKNIHDGRDNVGLTTNSGKLIVDFSNIKIARRNAAVTHGATVDSSNLVDEETMASNFNFVPDLAANGYNWLNTQSGDSEHDLYNFKIPDLVRGNGGCGKPCCGDACNNSEVANGGSDEDNFFGSFGNKDADVNAGRGDIEISDKVENKENGDIKIASKEENIFENFENKTIEEKIDVGFSRHDLSNIHVNGEAASKNIPSSIQIQSALLPQSQTFLSTNTNNASIRTLQTISSSTTSDDDKDGTKILYAGEINSKGEPVKMTGISSGNASQQIKLDKIVSSKPTATNQFKKLNDDQLITSVKGGSDAANLSIAAAKKVATLKLGIATDSNNFDVLMKRVPDQEISFINLDIRKAKRDSIIAGVW